MSRTISSNTTGPVVLGTADNPLYVTSNGTVTSSGSSDGVDGGSSVTTWTISNAGKIAASRGDGVSLASSGTNSNTGSIPGVDAVVLGNDGSVTNNAGTTSSLGTLRIGFGDGSQHHRRRRHGDQARRYLRRGLRHQPRQGRPRHQLELDHWRHGQRHRSRRRWHDGEFRHLQRNGQRRSRHFVLAHKHVRLALAQ